MADNGAWQWARALGLWRPRQMSADIELMCEIPITFPRLQLVGGPILDSRFNHQESVTIDSLDMACGEPTDGLVRVGPSVSLGRLGSTKDDTHGKFRASVDMAFRLQRFSSDDGDDGPFGGGVYLKGGISNRGLEQELGVELKWITPAYFSIGISAGYALSEPVFEAGKASVEHGPVFGLGLGLLF